MWGQQQESQGKGDVTAVPGLAPLRTSQLSLLLARLPGEGHGGMCDIVTGWPLHQVMEELQTCAGLGLNHSLTNVH